MTPDNDSIDPLRAEWTSAPPPSEREIRAIAALVREKAASVRREASARQQSGMVIAALLAVLTGLAAWRANWYWAGVGFAVCAASNLVALAVLATVAWRQSRHPDTGLSTRAYYDELAAFCDREARFLRSVKYWYALPLLAGVAIVGASIWMHTGSVGWSLLIGAIGPVLAWLGVRRMNDVEGVNALLAARRDAEHWLAEAGGLRGDRGAQDGA